MSTYVTRQRIIQQKQGHNYTFVYNLLRMLPREVEMLLDCTSMPGCFGQSCRPDAALYKCFTFLYTYSKPNNKNTTRHLKKPTRLDTKLIQLFSTRMFTMRHVCTAIPVAVVSAAAAAVSSSSPASAAGGCGTACAAAPAVFGARSAPD